MSVAKTDIAPSRALQRYYPWVVIGIAFLTVGVAFGMRNAFAVFLIAVIEEFHWSRGLASGALMLGSVMWTLAAPVIGILLDRVGPRIVLPGGSIIMALGFVISGMTHSVVEFYIGMSCRDPVGTSKAVDKTRQPALRIGNRSSAPCALRQRHSPRTIGFADEIQSLRDVVQRLIPTDPLPSGIGIVLRTCAFQRIVQPVGMVDQFRRGLALNAKDASVWMIGISIEAHDFPIHYGGDRSAMRSTERAITADGRRRLLKIIHMICENTLNPACCLRPMARGN